MDLRKTALIASYSARYSVRGGVGLVFLLLSLTFGLMVAHIMLQPVEQATRMVQEQLQGEPEAKIQERVLERITDFAEEPVAWVLRDAETGDADVDAAAADAADAWADYLLHDRPAMLSAIFLILLFGWPLIIAFGAFDLYAGDIGSRQLRYQLLRSDRSSIFFGRLFGTMITFAFVLLLLGLTVSLYMAAKLPLYELSDLVTWALYGVAALAIVTMPYVTLCSWVSAGVGGSFSSLTYISLIIGGVPLLTMFARMSWEPARYINYLLPWGFMTRLFHHEPAELALAIGGCLLQTALFGWLGWRTFARRDL